jgi:O-methyltransferase
MDDTRFVAPRRGSFYATLFDKGNLRMSPDRALALIQAAQPCLEVDGDWAELGVYQGSSAYLLADLLERSGSSKRLFLFDTFCRTPPESDRDPVRREGLDADVSRESVRSYLSPFDNRLKYVVGLIPETFGGLGSQSFSFLHVHLNLYRGTRDALEGLFPRLTRGGAVVIEDYGLHTRAGARLAADEFFKHGSRRIIHLPTGQAVAFKSD